MNKNGFFSFISFQGLALALALLFLPSLPRKASANDINAYLQSNSPAQQNCSQVVEQEIKKLSEKLAIPDPAGQGASTPLMEAHANAFCDQSFRAEIEHEELYVGENRKSQGKVSACQTAIVVLQDNIGHAGKEKTSDGKFNLRALKNESCEIGQAGRACGGAGDLTKLNECLKKKNLNPKEVSQWTPTQRVSCLQCMYLKLERAKEAEKEQMSRIQKLAADYERVLKEKSRRLVQLGKCVRDNLGFNSGNEQQPSDNEQQPSEIFRLVKTSNCPADLRAGGRIPPAMLGCANRACVLRVASGALMAPNRPSFLSTNESGGMPLALLSENRSALTVAGSANQNFSELSRITRNEAVQAERRATELGTLVTRMNSSPDPTRIALSTPPPAAGPSARSVASPPQAPSNATGASRGLDPALSQAAQQAPQAAGAGKGGGSGGGSSGGSSGRGSSMGDMQRSRTASSGFASKSGSRDAVGSLDPMKDGGSGFNKLIDKKNIDPELLMAMAEQKQENGMPIASAGNGGNPGRSPGAIGSAGLDSGSSAAATAGAAGSAGIQISSGAAGGGGALGAGGGNARCSGGNCSGSGEGASMNGGGGAASYSGGGSSGSETFAAADDPAKKAGKGTDSKKGSELAPLPELPGDPAKEFAALDKLFDAVAGKMKTDIAKGVDGALLSEAGAHTSKSGPVDPVALVSEVKEQAKEEQEMEKPLPEEKEVVRKVASLPPPAVPQEHGTFQSKHYLDTVDFDMSLFQRVKESLTKKVRDGQFNPGERHSSI